MLVVFKKFSLFFKFELIIRRLRKAYGITSQVKNNNGMHYLLFDCDTVADDNFFYGKYREPIISYKTNKGCHYVVLKKVAFTECVKELLECPYIDRKYVTMGILRGYWFLENHSPLFYPDLFNFMRIERT